MESHKEIERSELHKTIWRVANDLRGSVDGWDFKSYVLGTLFYRFISENLTSYLNEQERKAGTADFDYARLSDSDAERGRTETVKEKGFYILPSELFVNLRARARHDSNLNETLSRIFADIEGSAIGEESEDKETRAAIARAISASPTLRNKKDLIEAFVDSISGPGNVDSEWSAFVKTKRAQEIEQIITDENLNGSETHAFIESAFRDGSIPTRGTGITRILPPVSRFSEDNDHGRQKQRVLDELSAFFDRFYGLA